MAHHQYSPSKLEMISLCPASVKMGRDLPDTTSSDAERGTRLHKIVETYLNWLSNEEITILRANSSAEEMSYADDCHSLILQIEKKAEEKWGEKYHTNEYALEKKLSYEYRGKEIFNGTTDFIYRYNTDTVIVDWKFGFNAVTEAKDNLQGAAYALAAYENGKYGDDVTVIFFNPVIRQKTQFTFTDFDGIRDYILHVIELAESENPPINPGEKQCRYCKANAAGICPALHKRFEVVKNGTQDIIKAEPQKAFAAYSDEEIVSFYQSGLLVEKMVDAACEELKKRCSATGNCGGYYVKQTSGGREIDDIPEAFERLKNIVPAKAFLKACKLSLSKLAEEYYNAAPETARSKKSATEKLLVDLFGTYSQKKPREILTKIKQ